jgi:ADP-ribose pyrophosphatase
MRDGPWRCPRKPLPRLPDIIVGARWAGLARGKDTRATVSGLSDPTTVFTGKKFRVERRELDMQGVPHVYDIIVHPGAAVILPVLDDGRLLLIHNYRVAVGQELLELPAGTLDPGEPPAACAARELAEETGYRAGHLEPLVSFYSTPGILTERMHVFLATKLAPGPTAREAGEQIRLAPLPPAEALAAIHAGQISDGKTILALLYYERFRQGGGDGA